MTVHKKRVLFGGLQLSTDGTQFSGMLVNQYVDGSQPFLTVNLAAYRFSKTNDGNGSSAISVGRVSCFPPNPIFQDSKRRLVSNFSSLKLS
jgi:hypothetical protein